MMILTDDDFELSARFKIGCARCLAQKPWAGRRGSVSVG